MSEPVLRRRPVPRLLPSRFRAGPPGTLQRITPDSSLCRVRRGEVLVVQLRFAGSPDAANPQIICTVSPVSGQGAPREITLRQVSRQEFRMEHQAPACGSWEYQFRYSLNGGQSWHLDRFVALTAMVDPAGMTNTRMYTLIPLATGRIPDWIRWLDEIKAMDFNMVHLLPVTAMDASASPYSVRDCFDIDEAWLDPDDSAPPLVQFERFVHRARELGLGLCIDIVMNHVGVTGEIARLCPEWIVPDPAEPDGFRRAGARHGDGWVEWRDLALLDYDMPGAERRQALWSYMGEYVMFWARYAHYTGGMIRLDNLHSSHQGFVGKIMGELRREYPDLVVLGEFFADPHILKQQARSWGLNLVLGTPWGEKFAPGLRDYIRRVHASPEEVRYFFPITSHDSGTPTEEFGTAESTMPRYLISMLMGTGHSGMVQGVEYGVEDKIKFIGQPDPLDPCGPPRFQGYIRKINSIARRYPLFSRPGNLEFVDGDHSAVLAAFRRAAAGEAEDFLVIANLDTEHSRTIQLDVTRLLPEGWGPVTELTGHGVTFAVEEPVWSLRLRPCGVRVLRLQRSAAGFVSLQAAD